MPVLSSAEKSEVRKKYALLRADALAKRATDKKTIMADKKSAISALDSTYDDKIAQVDSEYFDTLSNLHESLIAELGGRSAHYGY